jgi:hypothetical protein
VETAPAKILLVQFIKFILGPGRYNPSFVPVKELKAPAYSIQGRKEFIKTDNTPGPGQCNYYSYFISQTLLHPHSVVILSLLFLHLPALAL